MKNLLAEIENKPPEIGETNHLICKFLGHDFDPVNAFVGADEYCSRCNKKCDENDRWFEWKSWFSWRFLSLKRIFNHCSGKNDKYSF